jgi:hypothetical protein
MKQRVDRQSIVKAHELLWHHFIEQHETPPKEIVLDLTAPTFRCMATAPGKFFNAYYGHHCYFPLYVFCGRHLLVSYLRTSNRSNSRHSWAILALLVRPEQRQLPGRHQQEQPPAQGGRRTRDAGS